MDPVPDDVQADPFASEIRDGIDVAPLLGPGFEVQDRIAGYAAARPKVGGRRQIHRDAHRRKAPIRIGDAHCVGAGRRLGRDPDADSHLARRTHRYAGQRRAGDRRRHAETVTETLPRDRDLSVLPSHRTGTESTDARRRRPQGRVVCDETGVAPDKDRATDHGGTRETRHRLTRGPEGHTRRRLPRAVPPTCRIEAGEPVGGTREHDPVRDGRGLGQTGRAAAAPPGRTETRRARAAHVPSRIESVERPVDDDVDVAVGHCGRLAIAARAGHDRGAPERRADHRGSATVALPGGVIGAQSVSTPGQVRDAADHCGRRSRVGRPPPRGTAACRRTARDPVEVVDVHPGTVADVDRIAGDGRGRVATRGEGVAAPDRRTDTRHPATAQHAGGIERVQTVGAGREDRPPRDRERGSGKTDRRTPPDRTTVRSRSAGQGIEGVDRGQPLRVDDTVGDCDRTLEQVGDRGSPAGLAHAGCRVAACGARGVESDELTGRRRDVGGAVRERGAADDRGSRPAEPGSIEGRHTAGTDFGFEGLESAVPPVAAVLGPAAAGQERDDDHQRDAATVQPSRTRSSHTTPPIGDTLPGRAVAVNPPEPDRALGPGAADRFGS